MRSFLLLLFIVGVSACCAAVPNFVVIAENEISIAVEQDGGFPPYQMPIGWNADVGYAVGYYDMLAWAYLGATAPELDGRKFAGWWMLEKNDTDSWGKNTSPTNCTRRITSEKFIVADEITNACTSARWSSLPVICPKHEFITYRLQYDPSGGGALPQTALYTNEITIAELPKPPSGYGYPGTWELEGSEKTFAPGDVVTGEAFGLATCHEDGRTVTLTAVATANVYKVTFDANGGTPPLSVKNVAYNDFYGELPTPTLAHADFLGWWTTESGGTQIAPTSKLSTASDQTLYAHWHSYVHTVTYDANGGKFEDDFTTKEASVVYGEPYGEPPGTPHQTNWTFAGWWTEKSGGEQITAEMKVERDTNHRLYAHWSANVYKVTFDANGGEVEEDSREVTYGEKYGELPVPTLADHAFEGWWTEKIGGERITAETKVEITSDQTLYAHWRMVTYLVVFFGNGATSGEMESERFRVDGEEQALNANRFERTGYTFEGWSESPEGAVKYADGEYVKNLAPAGEAVALYAVWAAIEYTVSFDKNGASGFAPKPITAHYGEEFNLPGKDDMDWPRRTFAGWGRGKAAVDFLAGEAVSNLTAEAGATVALHAIWMRETSEVSQALDCEALFGEVEAGWEVFADEAWCAKGETCLRLLTAASAANRVKLTDPDGQALSGMLKFHWRGVTKVGTETPRLKLIDGRNNLLGAWELDEAELSNPWHEATVEIANVTELSFICDQLVGKNSYCALDWVEWVARKPQPTIIYIR